MIPATFTEEYESLFSIKILNLSFIRLCIKPGFKRGFSISIHKISKSWSKAKLLQCHKQDAKLENNEILNNTFAVACHSALIAERQGYCQIKSKI